ncbi:MAG: FkbM family methyltransferase [bacterium]
MRKTIYKKIEEKLISLVAKNRYTYKFARFIGVFIYSLFIFPKYFIIKDFDRHFKILTIKKTDENFYIRKNNFFNDILTIYGIFINKEYETNFLNYLDNINGKIIVDIGAYIGDTTVFFGKRGAVVYAYEPSKELYETAQKNIEINNINAKIFNVGIGNKNTNAKMTRNQKDTTDSESFVIFDKFESIEKTHKDRFLFTEEIKLISLNEVLEQFDLVYLLKIDCEGCEFPAISSVKNENLRKIKYIIMEVHFMNVFDPCVITSKLKTNNFEVYIENKNDIGMLYAKNLT